MKKTVFAGLLAIVACTSTNSVDNLPQKPNSTEVLNTYLSTQFNDSISDALHYYVLVPQFGCMGCMQRTLSFVQSVIDAGRQDAFTYVVSSKKAGLWSIFEHGAQQIYTDSTGQLDRLNLGIAHITIVVTQADSVTAVHSISPQKLDSLASYFHFP